MTTLNTLFQSEETANWNALSARAGKGKTVLLSTDSENGPVITFRSRIAPSQVKGGAFIPVSIKRHGNSRLISLSISDEQADALFALLKRYRKKRRFWSSLFHVAFEFALSRK